MQHSLAKSLISISLILNDAEPSQRGVFVAIKNYWSSCVEQKFIWIAVMAIASVFYTTVDTEDTDFTNAKSHIGILK